MTATGGDFQGNDNFGASHWMAGRCGVVSRVHFDEPLLRKRSQEQERAYGLA